jgi:signal transduction histidine kinase
MLGELHAAVLQGAVTIGTAAVCWFLYARYKRDYFLWWSIGWTLYVLRVGAIVAFLATGHYALLFVHQVLTGWTALALLWAAFCFAQSARWRPLYSLAVLFPLGWSYLAIYELDSFMLAAIPAVLFLSVATLWTSWVFVQRWRRTGSRGSGVLAGVLLLWGLHHFDYPILRAKGAWNPWGYYLDILFVLAMGIGIVMLGLEELDRRARELERLSARMLRQHEDERRRLSLELHDQTAQVWAAVKLQLGLMRESAPPSDDARFARVLDLVDRGITSIRSVTTHLRPPLLDDLGLVPALRALVDSFAIESRFQISFEAPADPLDVSPDAALAIFRAAQEALSNVARHSNATSATVRLVANDRELTLIVADDGRGFAESMDEREPRSLGLTGMRERVGALRGTVTVGAGESRGASVTVRIPSTR